MEYAKAKRLNIFSCIFFPIFNIDATIDTHRNCTCYRTLYITYAWWRGRGVKISYHKLYACRPMLCRTLTKRIQPTNNLTCLTKIYKIINLEFMRLYFIELKES